MALELRALERPLDRMASVALRGERFIERLARTTDRYGADTALRFAVKRTCSFALRAGKSVICAWHAGMTLPRIEPRLGVSLEEVEHACLPEAVAVMRSAGWREPDEVVRRRVQQGQRCFAARFDGAIVAQLWTSRSAHNIEELWDLRLDEDEARTFDWYTLPRARGKRVLPALLSFALRTLAREGVHHVYTSIGGDNVSSLRAAATIFPVRREFFYFMVRGMQRPVVLGLGQSTYPALDPVERPFERINVSNLVV